jgi:hypothetical protein
MGDEGIAGVLSLIGVKVNTKHIFISLYHLGRKRKMQQQD